MKILFYKKKKKSKKNPKKSHLLKYSHRPFIEIFPSIKVINFPSRFPSNGHERFIVDFYLCWNDDVIEYTISN